MTFFKEERIFANWSLILSFIPGASMITVLSLKSNIQGSSFAVIPLFLQSIFGVIVGALLFAPKWAKLPLATENEFILYRYRDPFAKLLFYFRAYYLGLVIIPLLIHISVSSVFNLALFPASYRDEVLLFSWVIAFLLTFSNSLKNRVVLDALTGAINLIFMLLYVLTALLAPIDDHASLVTTTISLRELLLIVGCFWWMNNVIDMPDMRAQKLLVGKSQKWASWVILLPVFIVFVFEVFLVWGPTSSFFQPWMVQSLIVLNLVQIISSMQHWSGSLASQATVKLFPNSKKIIEKKSHFLLFLTLLISILWSSFLENTADALIAFFSLTAGVGPVYILRWFYWRINALTQFVAMLGPIAISTTLLWFKSSTFYEELIHFLPFEEVYDILLVSAMANVFLWLPTLFVFSKNRTTVQSILKSM
jgi:solute:Na+ symporter, SSS family